MARLVAMVPPPGFHMIRFHGVLAAHSSDRPEVVPAVEEQTAGLMQLSLFGGDAQAERCCNAKQDEPPRRKPWAWLLRHVFAIDVTVCPACEGRMRWLEIATAPDAIAELLVRAGLGPRPPPADFPDVLPAAGPGTASRQRRRRRVLFGQLELGFGVAAVRRGGC